MVRYDVKIIALRFWQGSIPLMTQILSWFWFCNGLGINLCRKATKNPLWKKWAFLSTWVWKTKMFQCLLKIIDCHKDNRSGKYMKIPSVLTHREIYSNCSLIPVIFIVERVEAFRDNLIHSYSSEWYEFLNIYIRRILSIGSHVFSLAPDFADDEIIQKWRNYSLWNTRSS